MSTKKRKTRPSDLVQWARRATQVLDQTNVMIGFLGGHDTRSEIYWSFAVQVGHCLLEGKPLLLIVPNGTELPPHLKAAASAIEYYVDGDGVSVQAACTRAFESIGVFVKH